MTETSEGGERTRKSAGPARFLDMLASVLVTLSGGAGIGALIGFDRTNDALWHAYILAVAACATAVAWGPWIRPRSAERRAAWLNRTSIWLCSTLLVCCIITPTYLILLDRWTENYQGRSVVIGSAYTDHGDRYRNTTDPPLSDERLLFDSKNKPGEMWTQGSIDRRRIILHALAAPVIFSIVHAVMLGWFFVRGTPADPEASGDGDGDERGANGTGNLQPGQRSGRS